jgi:hypothetical protein
MQARRNKQLLRYSMENTQKVIPRSSVLIAGLTASVPSIPDDMPSGVLAGINPITGLHGLGADRTHCMALALCKTSLQI